MKPITVSFVLCLMLFIASCAGGTLTPEATLPVPTPIPATPTALPAAPTATKQVYQSMNMLEIPAPSLANNLIGQSTQRTIYVYLPPSYNTSAKRYPAVYYLPGFGDSTMFGVALPKGIDALMEGGQVQEMILVIASGANKLGGSFYVNSPVTG